MTSVITAINHVIGYINVVNRNNAINTIVGGLPLVALPLGGPPLGEPPLQLPVAVLQEESGGPLLRRREQLVGVNIVLAEFVQF